MNRSPEGVKRRKDMGIPDEDEASSELAWSRQCGYDGMTGIPVKRKGVSGIQFTERNTIEIASLLSLHEASVF
ncbi:hypothetical protein NC651_007122 [Populus alba x Populus x berolinensis]|nr:hypothetical protein NC651_007122 [Populus alba x Populus x berolinensis]